MSSLRFLLSVAVAVLLMAGYLGSQYSYFAGRAPEWASKVDTPPIIWLSLLIFLAAIALSVVREKKESE